MIYITLLVCFKINEIKWIYKIESFKSDFSLIDKRVNVSLHDYVIIAEQSHILQ